MTRRSLPHLTAIAGLSGLITLVVAVVPGVSPVWIAVGPLLLVVIDTFAFSPVFEVRVKGAVGWLARIAQAGFGWLSDTPFVSQEYAARWDLGDAYMLRRRSMLRRAAGLLVVVGLAVAFGGSVWSPVWSFVKAHAIAGGAVLWFIAMLGVLYVMVKLRMAYMRVRARSVSADATEVEQWLQRQLDANRDTPRSVVLVASSEPVAPSAVAALGASSAVRSYGGVLMLSRYEILIVGTGDELDRLLPRIYREFGREGAPAVLAGRSEYPASGRLPENLIGLARSRLAPVTTPTRPRPRRPAPKRDPGG